MDLSKFFAPKLQMPSWWKQRTLSPDLLNDFRVQLSRKTVIPKSEDAKPVWLTRAKSYIGTQEATGSEDNPVILNWAKQAGGEIAREYQHDEIPWASLYIVAMVCETNFEYPDTLWALDFAKYGQGLEGPAFGAIAVMKRSVGAHVIFVVGRDKAGNLMGIGGNQSDAVNIRPFSPDHVVAYRWPTAAQLPTDMGLSKLPVVDSDSKRSADEAS